MIINKVYVAGPMRGKPNFNATAFDRATEHLRGLGYSVYNPVERDIEEYGIAVIDSPHGDLVDIVGPLGFDLEAALEADREYIRTQADTICLLPGWSSSQGASAEEALARECGLAVIVEADIDQLPANTELDHSTPLPRTPMCGEVRTVSATGGEKGQKLARYDLIPAGPLHELAEHFGRGAEKYAERNWEKGYEWSKNFAALNRHLWAFWSGEDTDPETGSPHLTAVAWHAFVLREFVRTHPEFDDRPATA